MKKRNSEGRPEVELPITPMLDMAFQLLIFFIFAYQPSSLEGHVDMALPSSAASAGALQDAPPVEAPPRGPNEEAALKIKLHTHHDGLHNGNLAFPIVVDALGGPANFDSTDKLIAYLQETRPKRVELDCDSGLKWDGVMTVMDACRRAKIKNVGLGSQN
ncbi:MAG: ExbD/TolR family protein [Gemmataceae bacterium]